MFTPPRVAARVRDRNLLGGWSLDCNHVDPTTGRKWDLSTERDINAAWKMFYRTKPRLLICSPPCTAFSQIQHLNPPVPHDVMKQAIAFVELSVAFCRAQMRAGRDFVFEHPAYASSWDLPVLAELAAEANVYNNVTHMCRYGMTSYQQGVEGLLQRSV